jgi:23S rRNA (guanosine2251-2'-O)-methyltransferase
VILYGINPVHEALLNSADKVQRVYFLRGKSNPRIQELIDLCRQNRLPVHFEAPKILDRKSEGQKHQGVVAEMAAHHYADFSDLLDRKPSLLVLLDGVEDPGNLGAVIRTAEAAGVHALLLPNRRTCGITPAVIKASAGAALHLEICRIGNVANTLEQLKDCGYWIVGLDMGGQESLSQIDTRLPLVLVIGSENRGLRRLVKEKTDFLVRLPMHGKVESLNLSAAAAILIYRIIELRSVDS